MLNLTANLSIYLVFVTIIVFCFGYFKGKNNEKNKRLKKSIKGINAFSKRRAKRNNDSAAVVKQRLLDNARK